MKLETLKEKKTNQFKTLLHVDAFEESFNNADLPELSIIPHDGYFEIVKDNFSFNLYEDFWLLSEDGKTELLLARDIVKRFYAESKAGFRFDRNAKHISEIDPNLLDKLEELIANIDYSTINSENIVNIIKLTNDIEAILYDQIDEEYHVDVTKAVEAQLPEIPFRSSAISLDMIYSVMKDFNWTGYEDICFPVYEWLMKIRAYCPKTDGDVFESDFKIDKQTKIKTMYHHYDDGPIIYIMKVLDEACGNPY